MSAQTVEASTTQAPAIERNQHYVWKFFLSLVGGLIIVCASFVINSLPGLVYLGFWAKTVLVANMLLGAVLLLLSDYYMQRAWPVDMSFRKK